MRLSIKISGVILGLCVWLSAAPAGAQVEYLGNGSGTHYGLDVNTANFPNTHYEPNHCFYISVWAPGDVANPHDQCHLMLYASTSWSPTGILRNGVNVNLTAPASPPNNGVPNSFNYPNRGPFTDQDFWIINDYIYNVVSVDISTYYAGQNSQLGWGPIHDNTTIYFQGYLRCSYPDGHRSNDSTPVVAVTFQD